MDSDESRGALTGLPPSGGSALSEDIRYNCYKCYLACCTGETACLDHDEANQLATLGLIDLRDGPGEDTDDDAQFHFYMTNRGESVAKYYRSAWDAPNTTCSQPGEKPTNPDDSSR